MSRDWDKSGHSPARLLRRACQGEVGHSKVDGGVCLSDGSVIQNPPSRSPFLLLPASFFPPKPPTSNLLGSPSFFLSRSRPLFQGGRHSTSCNNGHHRLLRSSMHARHRCHILPTPATGTAAAHCSLISATALAGSWPISRRGTKQPISILAPSRRPLASPRQISTSAPSTPRRVSTSQHRHLSLMTFSPLCPELRQKQA